MFTADFKSKIAFVDLAGWENAKEKEVQETKFINKSLNDLNSNLMNISKGNLVVATTKLTKILKPYIVGNSNVCMLYHISKKNFKKGLENIKDVVASTKIMKRENRSPLANIANKQVRVK